MTSAAVAAPVEITEHKDAPGRPTVETRHGDIALGGDAVRPVTTGPGDPRTVLDTLADRARAK